MGGSNEKEWKQQKQRNNGRNETMDGMEGRTEDGSGGCNRSNSSK